MPQTSPALPRTLTREFDYDPRTRVVFGAGSLSRLGELTVENGGARVLVVSDEGIRRAGHEATATKSLEAAKLDVTVFDDVHENPTTDDVERGLVVAREAGVDFIVGLGGGSCMDCAKGINFVLTNGGSMEDYWGVGKATKPMLPLIAVPTTAGTGSEAQSFALIARASDHMKMACGDRKAACRVAILDPNLTGSMSASVRAATGIDAVSHAIETYVTKPRNYISQSFSRRSWRLLAAGFPRTLEDNGDLDARAATLLGAHFAGAAIENSMLGATHSLANPLSAKYGTTHGIAIGVMLPHVVRFNAADIAVAGLYGDLAQDAELCDADDPRAADLLAEFVGELVGDASQPTTLRECGVSESDLPWLGEHAAKQWTANFNPRPVDAASLQELYRCAMA